MHRISLGRSVRRNTDEAAFHIPPLYKESITPLSPGKGPLRPLPLFQFCSQSFHGNPNTIHPLAKQSGPRRFLCFKAKNATNAAPSRQLLSEGRLGFVCRTPDATFWKEVGKLKKKDEQAGFFRVMQESWFIQSGVVRVSGEAGGVCTET